MRNTTKVAAGCPRSRAFRDLGFRDSISKRTRISRRPRRLGGETSSALLLPILPITRPAAPVRNRKDHYLGNHLPINQAERKLVEGISSEIAEVERPPLRCSLNRPSGLLYGILKLLGCSRAPLPIPRQRRQIFLLGLGMESQRLMSHRGLLIQQRLALLNRRFPRDSLYFTRLHFLKTASDFLLPGGVNIEIVRYFKAGDQVARQLRAFVVGQR